MTSHVTRIYLPVSNPLYVVSIIYGLEKLVAMNATKTELRLYTLAIIIAVDTILSSAERVYFYEVVN